MERETGREETAYYLKCLRCSDTNEKAGMTGADHGDVDGDPSVMACRLCDRYYTKGRLFLNNVG